MLAIEIEYLTGRAVATDYGERSQPEWPPHPQRLFSALVACHAESHLGASSEKALRWLETQAPPALQVDLEPGKRQVLSHWVPVNDESLSSKDFNLQHILDRRMKQERYFPSVLPSDSRVVFQWSDAEPSSDVRDALQALVARLTYLGHSSSMIRACLLNEANTPTLVPNPLGEYELRVPGPGRFDRLQQVHALRLKDETIQPSPGRFQRYTDASRTIAVGDFIHVQSLAFEETQRFGLAQTAAVAHRLRQALLHHLPDDAPELLSGHQADGKPTIHPHLALVPLSYVGHKHADGALKGFALLLPRTADLETSAMLTQACETLRKLTFGTLGELTVRHVETPRDEMRSLQFRHYEKPARTWQTVTPVILERFPKTKLTVEQIVTDAIERQGLPAPLEIETCRMPWLKGSPRSADFALPQAHLAQRNRYHVRIRFAIDIRGPLVLGAGRFLGMGLFLPECE
jgi:CRISPR-associated protein Csb2